jgi:IS605 OrfB family transposase
MGNNASMMQKTICCKLATDCSACDALEETTIWFANACNDVLQTAVEEKTSDALKLHKIKYFDIRESHGLSANLAVRAIRRVAGAMTKLKGKRKRPRCFRPTSVSYDARIFSFNEEKEIVSLKTTRGRIKIPLILADYQRKALKGQKPTSATLIRKGRVWYLHIVIEVPIERKETMTEQHEVGQFRASCAMGVDMGIKNIACTSTGLQVAGVERERFKKDRQRIRASLQSKNTSGAKRVLKRLSGKEKRRIRHENHVLSKQLVDEAKRHNCGVIRMEQLKGIRERTKTWNTHLNRMVASWSFYQLQLFVQYKAEAAGLSVERVDPAYTSQTCCQCLKIGSRRGEKFSCIACGDCHADINAASVIALGGAACKPARINSSR